MILRQAFERKKKEQFKSRIDITYSKATTICLLIIELTGWGANIGNSRAIFCRQKVGFHFVELSKHQKPYLPKEEKEQYRMVRESLYILMKKKVQLVTGPIAFLN